MFTEKPFTDFPFTIDERGRSASTNEDDHVRDLIFQVLFTSPGERVNRPEFGCGLKQLVFAPGSDALAAATEQLVHGSLIRWLDPVVAVEEVTVEIDDAELKVRVGYSRRDTGEKREDVFRHPIP
ncbi:MAG: GPW/gp25 family protein [Candidatus Nitronauta litoralis]|uniref:GPW/gp25 family protein n=1 Tax=Candidatus Nitronauta litoralis TaxID=2705533 RepID=A0A7T0BWU8_9BACT|nr:MAG: GPW/gp25 family protein [Candidatus Nitronauta litoralis]